MSARAETKMRLAEKQSTSYRGGLSTMQSAPRMGTKRDKVRLRTGNPVLSPRMRSSCTIVETNHPLHVASELRHRDSDVCMLPTLTGTLGYILRWT